MSARYQVEIRHNVETAHRLYSPSAPEKCRSIHGHSWWITVSIGGPSLDGDGMLVEFGAFKRAWRGWLDQHVDHHLVVSVHDPLVEAIRAVDPGHRLLVWPESPTTEVFARRLFEQAERVLASCDAVATGATIDRVHVQETSVNAAAFARRTEPASD